MIETPLQNINQLKRLAAKLQENQEFMAWILAKYQRKEHLDYEQIVSHFNTTPEMFVRLALCKNPNTNSANFAIQVREIATYTNIDPEILANVIRQVDSMDSLLKYPGNNLKTERSARRLVPGILAAARDRTENEETDSDKTNSLSIDDTKGGNDVAR
jgi:hypothetical protein